MYFHTLFTYTYHQAKIPISFWCRRELNSRSLIQPSETLPVELTETHTCNDFNWRDYRLSDPSLQFRHIWPGLIYVFIVFFFFLMDIIVYFNWRKCKLIDRKLKFQNCYIWLTRLAKLSDPLFYVDESSLALYMVLRCLFLKQTLTMYSTKKKKFDNVHFIPMSFTDFSFYYF